MIDHTAYHLACRAKALTLTVATTGSITQEATATGYARATGSYLTDGFAVGQQITDISGFTQTSACVIIGVTATTIAVEGGRTVQASGAGRTLTVGLPASRSWENVEFTPTTGTPYVEEQYVPGPTALEAFGPNGMIVARPMYVLHVYVKSNTGISGDGKYADKLITLFAPGTAITLASGDDFSVRADAGPYRGQRTNPATGWSMVPVNVPLEVITSNSI